MFSIANDHAHRGPVGAPGLHDRTIALCDAAGFSPRVSLEVQEPDLVPLAVASGAGVAVVGSNHVADRTFAGVESRPLAATEPLTSVLVEWVDDGATRQPVEFVEVLVELAHDTPPPLATDAHGGWLNGRFHVRAAAGQRPIDDPYAVLAGA